MAPAGLGPADLVPAGIAPRGSERRSSGGRFDVEAHPPTTMQPSNAATQPADATTRIDAPWINATAAARVGLTKSLPDFYRCNPESSGTKLTAPNDCFCSRFSSLV